MLDNKVDVVKVFWALALGRSVVQFCYCYVRDKAVFKACLYDLFTDTMYALDECNADVCVQQISHGKASPSWCAAVDASCVSDRLRDFIGASFAAPVGM